MLTLRNEPYSFLTLRLNGYEKLMNLKYAWKNAGECNMEYKDWKAMFDNDVFGAYSIRVQLSDSIRRDGKRIVRYERYVKTKDCIELLRRLLTL